MGKLIIHNENLTPEKAERLIRLCPFRAISYENGALSVSAACKMCKICTKKGEGVMEYAEEEVQNTVDKSLWKGILVYAATVNGKLHRVTAELCGKAKELAAVTGHPVYAILIGHRVEPMAKELLYYGVDRVFTYDHPALEHFRIEPYAAAFCHLIDTVKPSSVLVGATVIGRQLAPAVAARCRAGLTADCTVLQMKENTDLVQIRPAFGGNIMAQIVSPHTRPQFCTVRYKVFSEPARTESPSGEITPMEVTPQILASAIEILDVIPKKAETDISEAEVLVAIGRGASGEGIRQKAEELAALLGGTLACTRPLAEANVLDPKRQIGLSGRTVKPKLIVCLGISGAVQFAAGMKSSDLIVAVNTDPNAAIFDVAHVCVVGDVNEIVPKWIQKIKGDE